MHKSAPLAAAAALVWLAPLHSSAQYRLVKLGVIALDSRGQPVDNLTADDLQIADAGKPQKIALFRPGAGAPRKTDPPRPGEYSNRTASNVPHATLVLFDMLNGATSVQNAAKDYLARGLQPIESAGYLYLYVLTPKGDFFAIHGLPGTDTNAPAPSGEPWTRNIRALMDQAFTTVFQLHPPEMTLDDRVRTTYRALERIGGALAGIPGRKNVVWITRGVPISIGTGFDTVNYEPALRRLCSALNRAGVTIYPVLQVGGSFAPDSQDTLKRFAELTGGPKAADDAGSAVRQAMNDVRTSYLLGYYPSEDNWDGQFHKLRVTCSRKGVRLQAMAGYFAIRESASDEQVALDGAVASSFDAAEIAIRGSVSADAAHSGGAGRMTHLQFRIDPAGVRLTREGDRYTARLALQLAGYKGEGAPERLKVIPVDLALSAKEHAKLMAGGILFNRDILLGDSIRRVRLVVFDRATHALGSLTLPMPWAGK